MADEQQQQSTPQVSPQAPPTITFKRDEDFEALYANSVISEMSVWDLKLIFGILDQSVSPAQVVQHTSINVPWVQVKLFSYWVQLFLAIQEQQNGKILVPPSVLPPDPATINTPDMAALSPDLRDKMARIYRDWRASL